MDLAIPFEGVDQAEQCVMVQWIILRHVPERLRRAVDLTAPQEGLPNSDRRRRAFTRQEIGALFQLRNRLWRTSLTGEQVCESEMSGCFFGCSGQSAAQQGLCGLDVTALAQHFGQHAGRVPRIGSCRAAQSILRLGATAAREIERCQMAQADDRIRCEGHAAFQQGEWIRSARGTGSASAR